jgi:hypothetical protein
MHSIMRTALTGSEALGLIPGGWPASFQVACRIKLYTWVSSWLNHCCCEGKPVPVVAWSSSIVTAVEFCKMMTM